MIRPGLVSITFRSLPPERIVALAAEAGLDGIEWGGDVHSPHGDVARAREVARMTRDAGLEVAAYGSYYRAGESPLEGLAFETVLESAVALGAPLVRIWAGRKGSADADAGYRKALAADALRAAELASAAGVALAWEYHGNTLTDTLASARSLLDEAAHPALGVYWQPVTGRPADECLGELAALEPRLRHLHVFHWTAEGRRPFAEGVEPWRLYLKACAEMPGDRFALMEFVRKDEPAQLLLDSQVLRALIEGLPRGSG